MPSIRFCIESDERAVELHESLGPTCSNVEIVGLELGEDLEPCNQKPKIVMRRLRVGDVLVATGVGREGKSDPL